MESHRGHNAAQLTKVSDTSFNPEGRDELNLAEYPIALLADRSPNDIKTLVYHDRDESLTITGSDLLGLPTALDVDVIIGLLHLTKIKTNFGSKTVQFTRYELLRVLGWPDRGYYYERLTESLNRWVGVTLVYKKSWWDNETKTKGNHSFHILEAATVVEQEQRQSCRSKQLPLPHSSVRWSDEFFQSFQANNLKRLDLKVYFSLKSAISKQLYRFLDKRFYKKSEWSFDLRALACEHVGMSRNYEAWRLKQKLQPAINELTAAGFLKALSPDERFKRAGRGQWSVTFMKAGPVESVALDDSGREVTDEREVSALETELVDLGISAKTARELVEKYPEERIRLQVEVVEWLRKTGKRKIADRAGFLTQAIREDYSRPEGFVTKTEKAERQRAQNEQRRLEIAEARRKQEREKRLEEEQAKINNYWNALTEAEKEAHKAEAIAAADPESRKLYESSRAGRQSMAETIFRVAIRNPYLRSKLGLPPEEVAE